MGVCECVRRGGRGQGPPRRGRRLPCVTRRRVRAWRLQPGGAGGAGGAETLQPSCRRPRGPSVPSGPRGPGPAALGGGRGPLGPACRREGRGRSPWGAEERPWCPERRALLRKPGPRRDGAGAGAGAGAGGPGVRRRSWAAPRGAWSARGPGAGAGSAPSVWTAAPRSRAASGCPASVTATATRPGRGGPG